MSRGNGDGRWRGREPVVIETVPETTARLRNETGQPTLRELLRESYNWRALAASPYGLTPVLVVALVFFFVGLNQQVPNLAVLDIVRDLGFTLDGIIRFLNFIGIVTLLIALGPAYWADRHKRIWLLGGGLLAVGVVGPLAGLAGSPFTLGLPLVATGFLLVVANIPTVSLIPDWYPVPTWGKAFALLGLFQTAGTAVAFYTAGELIDAYGWRTTYVALFAPVILGGAYALWRLREPVRGYFERIYLGASEEIAREEEEAPSFAEAWRTIWGIRVFRRIFISDLFTTAGIGVFGLMLFFLLVQEYRFTPADLGRLSAVTALVGGVPGAFLGGGLIDAFARRRPAQLLTLFGVFSLVAAFPTLAYPGRPPVWVFYVVGTFINFGIALLGPTLGALYAWILPSHVRTLGGVMRGLAALPGFLFVVPIAAIIAQDYGISSALFVPFPLLFIGATLFITAAPLYELDARAKLAREFAWHEWRRAKEAGRTKLLVCRDLKVHYDGVQVLFGVDFEIDEGEVVAILGTNGAGKSTLLRAISGSHPASSGGISFDGRDITFMPSHEVARRGVIHMPGGRGVFPGLTVRENLLLGTWMLEDHDEVTEGLEEVFEIFPSLAERADDVAANLSGGQQQMLSLAQAFLSKPRLLMIDELSLGLAPSVVADLLEVVRRINKRGITVMVVEQSVNVALGLAQRAVFMEKGEVKFVGPTAELMARPEILRAVYVKGTGGPGGTGIGGAQPARAETRTVLEAEDVVKSFGGRVALAGVDLALRGGEVLGLIGPNGSGKTTLLEVMSGFVVPDAGRVHFDGVDVTELPPHARMQRGLVRRFQDARLFPSLTVFETLLVALDHELEVRNTFMGAIAAPGSRRAERRARVRADALIDLLELGAYRDKFVRELSTGVRRITDLACVLATSPKVLLLDEPSTGMAQAEAELLAPLLRRIKYETGCSLLVVEHDMALISSLAPELVALDQGQVIVRGTPEQVLSDDRVIESYLGGSEAALRRSGSVVP